ncbi:drug resistance transporter, EmrB/QacA subfamily [Saccharopolyspora kobensis]|uniref:Drug resistance transporter, EmrB/QacA subfamily n=1 Tax=Saccharopolyspora kobensis TaxID=146035 RepID=A0A1H6E582_9PSEU|nr:MFS transporter [Saccharopolyspora kobensis]SEG92369.1 drug resistance transporter, EmrB/QacA subfamily [Saccharopolyspora kobensis]SFD37073.1 drug resistance transporter, EmrB/QacA subfamily [Saccharopolyspora kobensis]
MNQSNPPAQRSRWFGLAVLCAGMFMIITDGTVVNVALPTIQAQLGFAQADLTWVVNAFVVPFGGLLLLAGRLGDLVGRKRMFLIGLVAFTLASALCGLATTQAMLIGARFVQGVGGALAAGVILGKITTMFSDPKELGKAFAIFSFVLSGAGAVGLVLGGVLTDAFGWHWAFFINVPIGIAGVLLAVRVLDDDEGLGLSGGTDFLGAAMVTAGLMIGVYSIVGSTERGWSSPYSWGPALLAVVLLAVFLVRQSKVSNPLLPLRLFRSRNFSATNGLQILYVAAAFGMFFVSALYLQLVLGYNPMQIGLTFLPMTAVTAVVTLGFAAKLNARFGERQVLIAGLIPVAVGLGLLARVPVDGTFVVDFLPSMLLLGAGGGLVVPALTALAMSDVPPVDSGLAGGLFNTMQQVGGALGVSVLAVFSTLHTQNLRAAGEPDAVALTSGYQLAFGITTGFIVLCLIGVVTLLRRVSKAAPEPVAETAS